MSDKEPKNIAFLDGQNLYMGTSLDGANPWTVDFVRFRVYLSRKYGVGAAYYYLGFRDERFVRLYGMIETAGFILVFKQHSPMMAGKKKGNVDADIVFGVMYRLYKNDDFDKIVLVSGDGDYKPMVDFLIEEGRMRLVLAPNRRFASSLYKKIGSEHFACLDEPGIRRKIQKQKWEGSLGS